MEKLVDTCLFVVKKFGPVLGLALITTFLACIFLPLFGLAVWVLLEVSGLMAVRTDIREGFWVFLLTFANLNFMVQASDRFYKHAYVVRQLLVTCYLLNAIVMLSAERPVLFWVVSLGLLGHIYSLVTSSKDPKDAYA